jgi:hypothetical protein
MSTVGPDEIRSVVARLTNADDLLRTAVVRVQRKERRR